MSYFLEMGAITCDIEGPEQKCYHNPKRVSAQSTSRADPTADSAKLTLADLFPEKDIARQSYPKDHKPSNKDALRGNFPSEVTS